VRSGPNGLDAAYVTLDTDQPSLQPSGLYSSGTPISGTKVVSGVWNFGYDPLVVGNPANVIANAPQSYTTNDKYTNANNTPTPSIPQKFAALDNPDLITKLVLLEQLENLLETLEIDNGVYDSTSSPSCKNYSIGGGNSDVVCPL